MEKPDDVTILDLFRAHEERDNERFDEIKTLLKEQTEILKPIADAFTSVTTLGKMSMTFVVVVSLIIGIVAGLMGFWKIK